MIKNVHGGDIYSHQEYQHEILDFSANINPLGIPDSVKMALHNAVDKCVNYPDVQCRKLGQAVAKREGVLPQQLVFGNGAADIIFRLVWAIKPKRALVLAPTFSEYALALETVNCEINHYVLLEENNFSVQEDILQQIPLTGMVFICNPNNPTGLLTERNMMIKILEKCKENNTMLVVDECFQDFLSHQDDFTLKDELHNFHNLFVLRAFTKIYAIPGVRLGFGICGNSSVLKKVESTGQAWSVSVLAQEAGIAAVEEIDYLEQTIKYIEKEREYLKVSLKELGFVVYSSQANYIFFKSTVTYNIKDALEQQGILIRSCENYVGLNNSYYRIAVKSREANQKLITALTAMRKSEE